MGFIHDLETTYTQNASAENAAAMEKYMKNHFAFHGLKTDLRRKLHKQALEQYKQEVKDNARELAIALYARAEREYHYSAIEILMKELKKNFQLEDIGLIEHLIITYSWWDSVDTIAKYLLGGYLQQFPQETEKVIAEFSASDDMWLNALPFFSSLAIKKKQMKNCFSANAKTTANLKNFLFRKPLAGRSGSMPRPVR